MNVTFGGPLVAIRYWKMCRVPLGSTKPSLLNDDALRFYMDLPKKTYSGIQEAACL